MAENVMWLSPACLPFIAWLIYAMLCYLKDAQGGFYSVLAICSAYIYRTLPAFQVIRCPLDGH